MKKNHITTDGNKVREHYLIEALKIVQRYEVVRAHTLAFSLFPNRSKTAAIAAVQRVLANGTDEGFIRAEDDTKTRRRYYALTIKGARYLAAVVPEYSSRATQAVLKKMSRANHRDWAILIAMASNARMGMTGIAEDQLWSRLRRETLDYFGHVPDCMTFFTNGAGKHIAVWHEVEASRRSRSASVENKRRAKEEGGVARSGMEHLRDLLLQLRLKRYVTFNGSEHTVVLVLHCATDKIQRELRLVIEDVYSMSGIRVEEQGYAVPFASAKFGNLFIFLNKLPASLDDVWLDTPNFPWPGAPMEINVHSSHSYLAKK